MWPEAPRRRFPQARSFRLQFSGAPSLPSVLVLMSLISRFGVSHSYCNGTLANGEARATDAERRASLKQPEESTRSVEPH